MINGLKLRGLLGDGMTMDEAVEFLEYNESEPFAIKRGSIYPMDGFDLLGGIESDSTDLVILDPSYNDWDSFCDNGLISEAMRILSDEGNLICFTKQPFDFNLRNALNPFFRREIVWTFTNGGAWVSNRLPLVSHQKIFHCVKDSKKSFFHSRTGIPYSEKTKDFKRSTKVFEGYEAEGRNFKKDDGGTWLRDHLHFNKPHTGKIPSKPQELYDILIKCLCPDGGLVVEPFCGSGNFARSCRSQGKQFIGSEIDLKTYDYAVQSLNKQTK